MCTAGKQPASRRQAARQPPISGAANTRSRAASARRACAPCSPACRRRRTRTWSCQRRHSRPAPRTRGPAGTQPSQPTQSAQHTAQPQLSTSHRPRMTWHAARACKLRAPGATCRACRWGSVRCGALQKGVASAGGQCRRTPTQQHLVGLNEGPTCGVPQADDAVLRSMGATR